LPINFDETKTFDDVFEKASDNPHSMPLIQIIPTEENKFLTIGYDRIITEWEVVAGGKFLESLGWMHTIGSRVNSMVVIGKNLCLPQPQKLLLMNTETLTT